MWKACRKYTPKKMEASPTNMFQWSLALFGLSIALAIVQMIIQVAIGLLAGGAMLCAIIALCLVIGNVLKKENN